MEKPYINFNGNSKEDIQNQFFKMHEATRNLIDVIARTDYNHGRNSTDPGHAQKMREEKMAVLGYLHNLENQFEEVVQEL